MLLSKVTSATVIFEQSQSSRKLDKNHSSITTENGNELETCYFTVLGMTCASCVDSIERNLSKIEGIEHISFYAF